MNGGVCGDCGPFYHSSYETHEAMAGFLYRTYQKAGLTTDLPDTVILSKLLRTGCRELESKFWIYFCE